MLNTVTIMGTMTRNVEIKYTQSGAAIGSFGIAVNERWADKNGQKQEKAHFFDIVSFGKISEIINQYFHKGSRIIIQGSLQFESWTGQDGVKRSKVVIKLSGFEFVDRKPQGEAQGQNTYNQTPQATPQNNMDDPNRHNAGGAMNRPPQHQDPAYNNQGQGQMPIIDVDENGEVPF